MFTVAVSAGSTPFDSEAISCIKSLHQNTDVSRIVTFIPESEWEKIPSNKQEILNRLTEVECGAVPIEGYPIAAKIAGFVRAAEYDDDWYILLDTDTIVLRSIKPLLDTPSQLRAKPIDVATSPWETNNKSEWQDLYAETGREYPGQILNSTVDNVSIPPLYNAGVVMTRDSTLPRRWLSLTREIIAKYPDEFFADQLALGIISQDYDVDPLPSIANFPLPWYLSTPSSAFILHYHRPGALLRIINPHIRQRVTQTGIFESDIMPNRYKGLAFEMKRYVRQNVGLRIL